MPRKDRQIALSQGSGERKSGTPAAEAGYGGGFTAGLQPGSLVLREEVGRKVQDCW